MTVNIHIRNKGWSKPVNSSELLLDYLDAEERQNYKKTGIEMDVLMGRLVGTLKLEVHCTNGLHLSKSGNHHLLNICDGLQRQVIMTLSSLSEKVVGILTW